MGLEIVFASAAERTQRTLVAFQACVDDHVSLPVALAFDDQATNRTLEWFATILRRALKGTNESCYLFNRRYLKTFRKYSRAFDEWKMKRNYCKASMSNSLIQFDLKGAVQ